MYIQGDQLFALLNLGKPVEQWLGVVKNESFTAIKWLRIDREKDGTFSMSYFEVMDEGNEDFLDVYEFSPIDPDEPYGRIETFMEWNEALKASYEKYGASKDKFVNAGFIQEEYRLYLTSK